ncbi:MAG: hypothetical protein N2C12_08850, partial [Planctomycetales bacterium]
KNLKNLEGLTGPLGENGAQIVSRIDSSVGKFDEVMSQLNSFTEKMNNQDGTLGQLLNNPELYFNLNRAVQNVERMTTELRPIMNDVRIFSSKIASDPGQLGLAGVLDRNKDRTKYPNYKTSDYPQLQWREDLRPPANWRTAPLEPTPVYPY